MFYSEFKESSKKHLLSCQFIVDNIDDCGKYEKYLLSTVYYLTGYILETIFKFSIYSAISYDKKVDIKELNSNGLTYTQNIQVHSLLKLKRIIEEKQITSFIEYENNKKLFNDWNSEVRYTRCTNFTKEEIVSFFKFSKEIFSTLQVL